jgi:hypothetical protein
MVEKSRSGVYIPVGMTCPSQLEATSPWFFEERAKRLHAEDVCPDCAAEQGYKRRESVKVSDGVLEAAARFHGMGSPVSSPTPMKAVPSDAKSPNETRPTNDSGRFIVVQHEGILDRLAYDTRRGPLTRESTQRLSENLVKVSKAVAQLDPIDEYPPPPKPNPDTGGPQPQPVRSTKVKSCSMIELLEDLHAIAAEMDIDISDPTKLEVTPRPTLGQLSEAPTPRPPSVTISLPERKDTPINDATTSPLSSSTYFTASSTRNNSVQGPVHLPSTILHAADYSPSTNPTSSPTALRSISRVIDPTLARKESFHSPNLSPTSPTSPSSPWSVQSPQPIERVRVADRWHPQQHQQQQQVLPLSPANRTTAEQPKSATEVHRAMREAAEVERRMRRARTHGDLGAAGRGQA